MWKVKGIFGTEIFDSCFLGVETFFGWLDLGRGFLGSPKQSEDLW